jgi:hypothetical protein
VRCAGVELRCLPGPEEEVVLAEDQAEGSVQYVGPVVALVGAQTGFFVVVSRWQNELVGLDASRPAGQGQDRRAVLAGDRAQVDAWVARCRRVDELVESDPVRTREG